MMDDGIQRAKICTCGRMLQHVAKQPAITQCYTKSEYLRQLARCQLMSSSLAALSARLVRGRVTLDEAKPC